MSALLLASSSSLAQLPASPPDPAGASDQSDQPAAPAQPKADEREPLGYADAIDTGLLEYKHGNYEEAQVHFARAHALLPSARTERALGNVAFELRNYGEAVTHLTRALESKERPLEGKLREDTERLLERAKVYVGEIHLDIEPNGATVSVDGVTVARGSEALLALVVGEHLLEFRANGRMPERRAVQVRGGERTTIQVVLAELEKSGSQSAPSAGPRSDQPTPLRKQWWLWTAVGAVAIALAVGIGVGVARNNDSPEPQAGSIGAVVEAP